MQQANISDMPSLPSTDEARLKEMYVYNFKVALQQHMSGTLGFGRVNMETHFFHIFFCWKIWWGDLQNNESTFQSKWLNRKKRVYPPEV